MGIADRHHAARWQARTPSSSNQEPTMNVSLKPLDQQVMVITGASSGIGLTTALAAAKQGVKLVLGARSKQTLDEVVRHIGEQGGEAIAVQVDVGSDDQVRQLAATAVERFGRIDTWVNDAGLSIYGRIDEVEHKDSERLFQTNFWGVVYGSLAALPHLKSSGGALINVGSEVSEATIPLQGMYSASKHAVKAFTDALRMELEADKSPVSVTLIQPTAVDTPFPEHAGNYMSLEPKLPTPMIEPEKVASAILDAATDPTDSTKVGAMSVLNTTMAKIMPSLGEAMAKMQIGRQQRAKGRCTAAARRAGCAGEATRTRRRPARPGRPIFALPDLY
jgi:short-subunit dehydrogenase